MGRTACAAISLEPDLKLVGGFARTHAGEALASVLAVDAGNAKIFDDLGAFYEQSTPHVVVDFTTYPTSVDVAREAVDYGVSPVIGATGWTQEDVVSFADRCDEKGLGALLVPNFALGAVLMMRFAEEASRFFPTVEIVEMHHDAKRDKPSGTAKLTAERIEKAGVRGSVAIHSVRLRGLVAHQEVLFGGTDELLTIRHDSFSRQSFMNGVLLAIRKVREQAGLVVGLDRLVGEGVSGS